MKKLLAVIWMQIAYYLLLSFVLWQFFIFDDIILRIFYLLFEFILIFISVFIYIETPDFLKEKTPEQKKAWLKKYIWDLHEELSLLWEAYALQKKISEFRSKQ